MTKNQAVQAVARLTSGTIARIIGSTKYERIDDSVNRWVLAVVDLEDAQLEPCETWVDVLGTIGIKA